jgi:hypothetical protein
MAVIRVQSAVVAALIVGSGFHYEGRWVLLVQGDTQTISVDTSRIAFAQAPYDSSYRTESAEMQGARYAVWLRWRFAKSKPMKSGRRYKSYIDHTVIDCQRRRMGSYNTTYYGADGSVVDAYSIPAYYAETEEVVPESYGEEIVDAFCIFRFQQLARAP